MSTEFAPPIREVIVFQPESFPLHRWDNSSPTAPPCRKIKHDVNADMLPKLPFRRSQTSKGDDSKNNLNGSITSICSDDTSPRCPGRSNSPAPLGRKTPRFLAAQAVGPCRRPPSRTHGYNQHRDEHHHSLDLHQIPLKPITFNGKKVEEGFEQVLQEVVMDRSATVSGGDGVNLVFCIRRPGCGQCREHGMQLAEIVKDQPHVTLTGVIKETKGLHSSIRDFYSNYFTFPLYLDQGWDLYHTIGNKKLSVFKLCARSPALEVRYAKRGIRNIPLGGDLFTQGGVLIFDKDGKLRFVYYECYGKPLDMEAIRWAIEEANKPMDVCK